MDTANLSYAHILFAVASSFLFAGIGLAIGRRVLPLSRTHRRPARSENPGSSAISDPAHAEGRLFPTEILGLDGNVIRYRDGSFGKAYSFEPANTLYDDERLTEQRIEELKTLLKFEKPNGTIIQFRFCNKPDDGTTLKNHLRTRNTEKSDPLASLLQATNLALYEEAIRSGSAMTQTASVWIRVPTRDIADKSVLSRNLPGLMREIREQGLFALLLRPVIAGKNIRVQSYLAREAKAEKLCREQARRVFQAFEVNFPKELRLREMTAGEVFREMFVSHRRDPNPEPRLSR